MASDLNEPCPAYSECEKALPTIEEESDEKIKILVDSLDNSLDGVITNQQTTITSSSKLTDETARLNKQQRSRSEANWSYEKWTLVIGGTISGLILLIGLIVGFILWLVLYLRSREHN